MAQTIQSNVPPPQQPIVDNNGVLTKAGLDFFVSILNQAAQQVATDAVATGIAAKGTTIATATALTADFNRVDTVSATATGVSLQSRQVGQMQKVLNNGGGTSLNVYPPPGVTIDALGASAAYALSSGKQQNFEWTTTTTIRSTQLG